MVNLTNSGTWRQPIDELIPVGPLKVRVKLPQGVAVRSAKLLVATGAAPAAAARQGWVEFELKSVLDHEVVVIS